MTRLLPLLLLLLAAPATAGPILDLDVVGDATLTRNAEAAVDVTVRLATSLAEGAPLEGATVRIALESGEDAVTLLEGATGADGRLHGPVRVPDVPPGEATLLIVAEAPEGRAEVRTPVTVLDATRLLLRTDRGIYRPGQTVRFALVAVNDATGRPLATARATVSVTGPRGIAIWRGELETDAVGMVAGELPLSDDLVLGTYTLKGEVDGTRTSTSVDVRLPVIPAFAVDVDVFVEDGHVAGEVAARYLYGEPVAGSVSLDLSIGSVTRPVAGTTDASGRFAFRQPLGGDAQGQPVRVTAHVTDGAGRSEVGRHELFVPGGLLDVVIVPDSEQPPAGGTVRVSAFAVEPSGQLAPADLRMYVGKREVARGSSGDGFIRAELPVPAAKAEDGSGGIRAYIGGTSVYGLDGLRDMEPLHGNLDGRAERLAACLSLGPKGGDAALELRSRKRSWSLERAMLTPLEDGLHRAVDDPTVRRCVDRALAKVKGPRDYGVARVELTVDQRELEWMDPAPIALRVVATTADGRQSQHEIEITPEEQPEGLKVRLGAPVVAPGAPVEVLTPASGPLIAALLVGGAPVAVARVEDGRALLQTPPGAHGLATVRVSSLPRAVASGEEVQRQGAATVYLMPRALDVDVQTEGRLRPGQDTVVRVQVRDEAGAPQAGVGIAASVVDERILRLASRGPNLAEVFASSGIEGAELAGVTFSEILQREPSPARNALLEAILWTLPPDAPEPFTHLPGLERLLAERERILEARALLVPTLAEQPGPVVRDGALVSPVAEILAKAGFEADALLTPFGTPIDEAWLGALHGPLPVDQVARAVTWMRLDTLADSLLSMEDLEEQLKAGPLGPDQLTGDDSLPESARVDAWGTPFVIRAGRGCLTDVVAAGPDATLDTDDDLVAVSTRACYQGALGMAVTGVGYGGGGHAFGTMGLGARSVGTTAYGVGGGIAPTRTIAVRKRFDETVLWSVGVPTDAQGFALLDVTMADSVTGWQVDIDALSPDGRAGSGSSRIETFLPLHADVDVPPELTLGDHFTLTAVAANHSGQDANLTLKAAVAGGARLDGPDEQAIEVQDGATFAVSFPIVAEETGEATVTLTLVGPDGPVDAIERTLRIEPEGHLERALSTATVRDGEGVLAMTVPGPADRASTRTRLRLFRGPLDQALDGVEDMLREPHGCFEQTSSTTYPNLLILRLLGDRPGMDEVRDRARDLVTKGYQRLLTFEVAGGGFSWFGSAPANRVLTAYGLVEFADMAKVAPVDPALIARTRDWLVGLQREDGSWEPDAKWLHDWSAVQGAVSTTAWITWALAEAGGSDDSVARGLAFLRANEPELAERPYLLALWAAAERAASAAPEAPLALLADRAEAGAEGVRWAAGDSTMLYGSGKSADVEVTALALRAHVGDARGGETRDGARRWLWSSRSPQYGWGTTQATVQTLRAVALQAETDGRPPEGPARILLDGREVAVLDLATPSVPTVDLPALAPGEHTIGVETGPGTLLADLRGSWRRLDPPAPLENGLRVALHHDGRPVRVGHTTRLSLTVTNPKEKLVPMPTVVAPVPPGFRPTRASLAALKDRGLVTRADDMGSEIHLYRESLGPGETVELSWELEAVAPCDVTQRGATAYAYYSPEQRGTSGNLRLVATPR